MELSRSSESSSPACTPPNYSPATSTNSSSRVYFPNEVSEPLLNDDITPACLRRLEQVMYMGLVNYTTIHYSDMVKILELVRPLLEKEGQLVEVGLPVTIFGALNGDREYLDHLKEGMDKTDRTFLFLGNYSGGCRDPEVLLHLFLNKLLHPEKVILLRGNFEQRHSEEHLDRSCVDIQQFQGWMHTDLQEKIKDIYEHMPLACLVDGRYLCMHGGIHPNLTSLDSIRQVPKPLKYPIEHELGHALLTANPMWNLKGFITKGMRSKQVCFGQDVLSETLKRLNVKMLVRANEIMKEGFGFFPDRSCVTLISTDDVADFLYIEYENTDGKNLSAMMTIEANDEVKFECLSYGKTFSKDLPRGDHAVNEYGDENYHVFEDTKSK